MKLLQFFKENKLHLGVATELGILDVSEAGKKYNVSVPGSLQELLSAEDGMKTVEAVTSRALEVRTSELFLSKEEIHYAPVVTNPGKIVCVGLNYIDHAKESKMDIPTSPVLFSKFNNALSAHLADIPIPEGAKQIDYEAELVVVIGKKAKNVSKEEALSYVFGYTIGNDVSARDLQFRTGQWLLGKSPDGFAPVGPFVVTSDEIDPNNLNIECRINGEIRQKANAKDMIFDCATLVSYVSTYMTLKPGDLIFTGTPDGVILGYSKDQQVWLTPGDEMVVSIDKLGELKNIIK
ncbi:5-carboxymethyl-2-hydroxymuconate isomerase [Caldibacillus thermoamylovorans]|uniref:fumarylacetoacetate hydrolase family protein n=1 Tax=Caldibacillus thermoamylovorans TaxID=35841 RepID=UPI000D54B876|nr:fumarylacetoacetate hydrolase family protein [Caldibacillus thermoamylovorans]AWI13973.1 5-carboxymethyl-2-hydroxymuconate isomerase [Caldibacillus thermoamylovorans]